MVGPSRRRFGFVIAALFSALASGLQGTVLLPSPWMEQSDAVRVSAVCVGTAIAVLLALLIGNIADEPSGFARAYHSLRLSAIVVAVGFWAPRIAGIADQASDRSGAFALVEILTNLGVITGVAFSLWIAFFATAAWVRSPHSRPASVRVS